MQRGDSVLRQAIISQKRHVVGSSLLASAHQGCEAAVPLLVGVLIDQAVSTGSTSALVRWITVLAMVFVALSLCYRFAARTAERGAEQATHRMRVRVSERVLDPCGGAETGRLPGTLLTVATTDARRVGAVNGALPFAIAGLVGLLVSAVTLLRISIPLGLLVLLGTPPLLWLTHLVGKPLERRSGVEQDRAAHASGVAADLVSGLRVLKGIGAENSALARYRRTSRTALGATLRAARAHAGHDGAILALTGVFIAVVALVGAHLAAAGVITVGELVAAVGLAQYLLGPFQIFAWANGQFARARASAERVSSVLTSPPAVRRGSAAPSATVRGALRLRGLTHGTLHGLDLDVAPGELLAVVTADPAAATDLLRCVGMEADPDGGAIELDGRSFADFAPGALRAAVLVAAHDADLFEGSVLDNVAGAGPPGALARAPDIDHGTSRDVNLRTTRALTAAAADEVIAALPEGAATVMAERGRSLSGGQRQRVALARALATDAPVLVLHDPTTAVDAVTEARIAGALPGARSGRTTVLVTTSPALLAISDRVVVLDNGRVRTVGTHADLVETDPGYRTTVLS